MRPPTALTIAGSDSGGGAGIQADLKTFLDHRVYGMSVLTALTAQNTLGVQAIFDVSPEFLREQLQSIRADLPVDAIKIGMVADTARATVIADFLESLKGSRFFQNPTLIVVNSAEQDGNTIHKFQITAMVKYDI